MIRARCERLRDELGRLDDRQQELGRIHQALQGNCDKLRALLNRAFSRNNRGDNAIVFWHSRTTGKWSSVRKWGVDKWFARQAASGKYTARQLSECMRTAGRDHWRMVDTLRRQLARWEKKLREVEKMHTNLARQIARKRTQLQSLERKLRALPAAGGKKKGSEAKRPGLKKPDRDGGRPGGSHSSSGGDKPCPKCGRYFVHTCK